MKSPHREALRWFCQAEDDCRFVQWAWQEQRFFDKGCFIAQQSGEKALKACLYALGSRRVIGHSLHEMATDLSDADNRFRGIAQEAKRLDRYYIATRYPNGLPGGSPFQVYDLDDLKNAHEDVAKVLSVCRGFLEEKGAFATPPE